MDRFEGATAIISGAASGIAKATAMRLASEGCQVVLGDLNGDGNDETAKDIKDAGGEAVAMEMDVREKSTWQGLFDLAIDTYGKVDHLCNIAGIVNNRGPDTVVDVSLDDWHWVIETNLTGTLLGMQTVLPHMLERGQGSIVNISSMAAERGLVDLASYSASKGGIAALTRQVAMQHPTVRTNAIAPGTINTPILGDVEDDFSLAHIIPRLGEAPEVAGMVAYLHSADAAFLTGLTLPMDGGWSVKT